MLNISEIIDRIIEVKELKNSANLAEYWSISPATVSTWKKRNSVPIDKIFAFCQSEGVSLDYIFTGEGEKYKKNKPENFKVDTEKLQAIISGVEKEIRNEGIELEPDKKARLISLLYELYSEDKEVDKATVIKYLRLAA